jgi:hypothetical protein
VTRARGREEVASFTTDFFQVHEHRYPLGALMQFFVPLFVC